MAAQKNKQDAGPGPAWGLTEEQLKVLDTDLKVDVVKQNPEGYDYLPGDYVMRAANAIFGFAGWRRETKEMRLLGERDYAGKEGKTGTIVAYAAHATVYVRTADGWVESDGWGYGESIYYKNVIKAHENAIKGAETDATKRALVKWGDQLGLALYDKGKGHVDYGTDDEAPAAAPAQKPRPAVQPAPAAAASPSGEVPLAPSEFFPQLVQYGYKGEKQRNALKDRAGIETPWAELTVAEQQALLELAAVPVEKTAAE